MYHNTGFLLNEKKRKLILNKNKRDKSINLLAHLSSFILVKVIF